MPRARTAGWLVMTMVIGACSGQASQSPSVAEYAEGLSQLLATMNAAISGRDAEMQSSPATIDTVRARIDGDLLALDDFLDGFRALEPPVAFADDHGTAVVAVQDLREATKTLADIAHSVNTLAELDAAVQGAPIEAIEEASERSWEMCRQAQAAFDDGVERAIEFSSPWLQTSATEPIDINLECFVAGE